MKSTIHFMKIRNVAFVITVLITIVGLVSLFHKGLNLGLDFTGGTSIELLYEKPADLEKIRLELATAEPGQEQKFDDAIVQSFGSTNSVLIRLKNDEANVGNLVAAKLHRIDPDNKFELISAETVGAQVGKELLDKGGIACLLALAGILIYLAFRFQWKFGLGAIASLFHDLIVTLGVIAFFQIPVDLTVFAAILAMIGYSLNDTIIIYDRVRENFRVLRKADIIENIDVSVTQTLLRTIATSTSTAMALIALLIFGGPSLGGFALVMLIGVFVGTYSSIYIAGPVLVWLKLTREDLLPPPSSQDLKEQHP
ncbi:protein translocase subunit SecF [Entomomonas sp. E2T0]|nr:protein translocase subunit SecF [Entomomonas sp. E2T0]UYZ85558.1 protein translocase subunit SecF [Entomomonas sp. E2T0]